MGGLLRICLLVVGIFVYENQGVAASTRWCSSHLVKAMALSTALHVPLIAFHSQKPAEQPQSSEAPVTSADASTVHENQILSDLQETLQNQETHIYTRAELNRIAEASLIQSFNNQSTALDWTQFKLFNEYLLSAHEDPSTEALENRLSTWNSTIEGAPSNFSNLPQWRENIRRTIHYIYPQYFTHYLLTSPRVSAALDHDGVNCSSESQIMTGLFMRRPPTLPAHYVYAVQTYGNHVQPIIYNTRTQTIWNLINGNENAPREGKIWNPAIVWYQYLIQRQTAGENVNISVSLSDLLIANFDAATREEGFRPLTGDDMAWPATNSMMNTDTIIRESFRDAPYDGNGRPSRQRQPVRQGTQDNTTTSATTPNASWNNFFSHPNLPEISEERLAAFRNQEQEFLQAPTRTQKFEILKRISRDVMSLISRNYESGFNLIQNYVSTTQSFSGQNQNRGPWQSYSQITGTCAELINWAAHQMNFDATQLNDFQTACYIDTTSVRTAERKFHNLRAAIQTHPDAFLVAINRLPSVERNELLSIMSQDASTLRPDHVTVLHNAQKSIIDFMSSSENIRIESHANTQPQPRLNHRFEDFLEIEFIGEPSSFPINTNNTNPPIHLSAETYLDTLYALQLSPQLASITTHWNDAVTTALINSTRWTSYEKSALLDRILNIMRADTSGSYTATNIQRLEQHQALLIGINTATQTHTF